MVVAALVMLACGSLWFGSSCGADALQRSGKHAVHAGALPGSALSNYALHQPDLNVELPPRLREVSGLTDVSQTQVACIQDEEGTIFVYDLQKRSITREVRFGPGGDYEGLTRVGDTYYVLRSDGQLSEVAGLGEQPSVKTRMLSMLPKDNEGLAWDFRRQRLLVAPKSRWGKGKEYKNSRPIFVLELKSGASSAQPLLMVELDELQHFAERYDQPLPDRGKGPKLEFRPASLAVHPVTRETFILSAIDGVLASFDEQGRVTGYALLAPDEFPQAEGITFLPNGDLVITSEAAGKKPRLIVYKWRA